MHTPTRHWTTLPSLVLIMALVGCNSAPKSGAAADDKASSANEQGAGTGAATAGAQRAPELGQAHSYIVLGGSTVTNSGSSSLTGDLGVSPGTAVTGFPPGTMTGATHAGDDIAAAAMTDLGRAFEDAAGRSTNPIALSGNLGGRTLTSGLYKSGSSLEISSGDLTLDAGGDANAVFIFQIASALTVTSGREVILSGGARAENIFWQVGSSATLGTKSVFQGTLLAGQSITLQNGATLHGRALARVGAVTLDNNAVALPS